MIIHINIYLYCKKSALIGEMIIKLNLAYGYVLMFLMQ